MGFAILALTAIVILGSTYLPLGGPLRRPDLPAFFLDDLDETLLALASVMDGAGAPTLN